MWQNLNFYPLQGFSRYCDQQLEVGENYSYIQFQAKNLQFFLFKPSFYAH